MRVAVVPTRSRFFAALARLPDIVAAALLGIVTALVFTQVLVRYALGGSLVWSEELTRLLFVWMVLVAAASAEPMRVAILVDVMPARLRALTQVLGESVVFALILLLIYGAWGMMDLTQFDTYTALGISVRWMYLGLLVGCVLWLVRSIAGLAGRLRALFA
jgi:TRAP-type C4-dicarboxylate transport system permease small subunit